MDLYNAETDTEYADNLPSRFMFRASQKITPGWCKTPDHWTVRIMNYFWTDCSCCLLFRGFIVGGLAGVALGVSACYLISLMIF